MSPDLDGKIIRRMVSFFETRAIVRTYACALHTSFVKKIPANPMGIFVSLGFTAPSPHTIDTPAMDMTDAYALG